MSYDEDPLDLFEDDDSGTETILLFDEEGKTCYPENWLCCFDLWSWDINRIWTWEDGTLFNC